MEQALGLTYTKQGRTHGKYALVKYADDFAVFCPTKEAAEAAKIRLSQWLDERGLRLSAAKTHIRHLTEGFEFLGFHIRQYPAPSSTRNGYKLLIKPSKTSVQQLQGKLRDMWRKHQGTPTRALIREMNPVIRGWSNYFRTQVASQTFRQLDDWMYYRAQRYAKRRHPKKSTQWRVKKYWGCGQDRQDRWVFMDKTQGSSLIKFAWVTIKRHVMVPSTYSPDDPTLQDYWRQRRKKTQATGQRYRKLFAYQKGTCPVCHQPLENGEDIHMHHVIPKKRKGTEALDNLRLVHLDCHRQIHSKNAPFGVRQTLEPCTG